MPFDPAQRNETVKASGLRELQRALRRFDRDAARQLNRGLRRITRPIALAAGANAPVGEPSKGDPHPGQLAGAPKATTIRGLPAIRVSLDYAGVHEWGGTIRPRGRPIEIKRSRYLGRALHEGLDDFTDQLALQMDQLALRLGWR